MAAIDLRGRLRCESLLEECHSQPFGAAALVEHGTRPGFPFNQLTEQRQSHANDPSFFAELIDSRIQKCLLIRREQGWIVGQAAKRATEFSQNAARVKRIEKIDEGSILFL